MATTQKHLAAYSAIAAAFLAGKTTNAQIIYTDLDPDIHFEADGGIYGGGGTLYFDMDDNGTNDLRINVWGFYHNNTSSDYGGTGFFASAFTINNSFDIVGLSNHNTVCCDPYISWNGEAMVLPEGHEIGPAGPWFVDNNGSALLYASNYVFGSAWMGTGTHLYGLWGDEILSDQYIGFRKKVGANSNYGWIRVTTTHTDRTIGELGSNYYTLTIHDYAFNATINDPLMTGEGFVCAPPLPTGTFFITPTSAKVKWNAVASADEYDLFYRQTGATGWTKKHVDATQKKLIGLLCNTSYEWKVRSACGDENSAFSAIQIFTTAPCRLEGEGGLELLVYPNPASEILYVELTDIENVTLELFDITGHQLNNISITSKDELISVDIASLPKGIYILHVSNASINEFIKFVHQ